MVPAKTRFSRLPALLENVSLRMTLALALIIGLAVPAGISTLMALTERRAALFERLDQDHDRIVGVLALGMQTPLWELRPGAGEALIEALMLDQRVTAVAVTSTLTGRFLEVEAPERRRGATVARESPVLHNGETIGRVRVEMDTGALESRLAGQWGQVLLTGLLQLITGLLIVFALLRHKVLNPLQRLVEQSKALAAGTLDRSLDWHRSDELGIVGRSFEAMRCSLHNLVLDLENRNRTLQEREAELADQTVVLKAILDNMTDGIALVDRDLCLVAWNERFIELLELPRERVRKGTPIRELIESNLSAGKLDPTDREAMLGRIMASLNEPSFIHFRLASGRHIDVRRRPMPAGGVVSTYTDVTEEVEAEQEIARQSEALYQSEKINALGSLLAGVAHELNNPLSVVVGRTLMLEEASADPKTRSKVKKVRLAAERCAKIVKTFLAIARQQPPERVPVQLNEVLESAVELLGYALRTADVETILDLDPALPELAADADQLARVFTNLIVNAQQALQDIAPPRRLTIASRYQKTAGSVEIAFTDNGPGIPTEYRSRIFEPFYTNKPVGVGTGIGLSFSYGVIQCHGGRLTLENPPEGGARFVITLPLVAAAVPAQAPAAASAPGVPCRAAVLIVDDETDIAEMLGDILAREGHRVEIAASGNAALRRLAEQDYDLVLSDLKMPDLDGPGLYRCLRQTRPQLAQRVVFITGDTLGMGASDFLAQTGRPVIEKPFVPEEVVRVVNEVLK